MALPKKLRAVAIKKPFMNEIADALTSENLVALGGHSRGYFAGHAMTLVAREWSSEQDTCVYKIRDNYDSRCHNQTRCRDGYHFFTK